jgi:GntR family transcriptional regulator, transcriptional repressor for pyruvate dehydrogenase complex
MARVVMPVVRTTLSGAVFEQLISFIVHGQWKAGDRLPPERDLCMALGIARTSLREALKALELVGMLDSRVGDGTFVCPRSEFLARPMLWAFTTTDYDALRDVLEARTLMEVNLAGLAALRASDAEIERAGDAIEMMRAQIAEGQSILEVDMAFHEAIGSGAHNVVLSNAVQMLRNLQREWIYLKLLLPNIPHKVIKDHTAIYEAIRNRDEAGARAAMRDHLEQTSKLVEQVFQEHASARRLEGGRKTKKLEGIQARKRLTV